jgi:protein KRI1
MNASYIFNRGWVNEEDDHIPSYNEIIGDDEVAVEAAENFENTYNFRFEEMEALHGPGSSYSNTAITTHARDVPDAVRRKDTRRTEERQRRKERKDEEKLQQVEELKRLKNLKKKEIMEKLKSVQALSGIADENHIESAFRVRCL